jgi:lipid A biosynthesis lauroyl/palmitoleoyl acyltransferase
MTKTNFYHPKFLPTWLMMLLMLIGSKLPFNVQVFIGKYTGRILYRIMSRFRKIATINISNCFPQKNRYQIEHLVKQNFEAIGISFFETADAFFASNEKIEKKSTINNQHYLTDALENGQGVILLSGHFMPLMLGGRVLLLMHTIANIYRPQNNKLFDEIMRKRFIKNGALMIKTKDIKSMIKALKSGMPIWYAPDQDFGEQNSVFAPFFNIPTATLNATSRLASIPNTKVIPFLFSRTSSGYELTFERPIADYPNENEVENATKTNKILQSQILKAPEQYLWIHRRFKTRKKDDPSYYEGI